MRVLAIDTALESCSAAVLDTENGGSGERIAADGARPAEALMPLIGGVMKQAAMTFSELDRIAVTTGPAASQDCASASAARGDRARRDQARGRAHHLGRLRRAAYRHDDKTAIAAAIDARHHTSICRFSDRRRTLIAPRIVSIADAVRAAANGPVRIVGTGQPCWRSPGRRTNCRRCWWTRAARRTSSGSRASPPPPTPAQRAEAALSARARRAAQDAARLPRDDRDA